MKEFLIHHYYLGILFSAIYTIGSALWSYRVERRLKKLRTDTQINQLSIAYAERDLSEVQSYLEKSPTGRFKSHHAIRSN